jgi:hypothetical protein
MGLKTSLTIVILLITFATPAAAGPNDLRDEGVGTYSDPSVANQISNFTINRQMVSCGVGTMALDATGLPKFSGPFAMLMYAKDIEFYFADHLANTIRAAGRMRSITHVGGTTVEDVDHDFVAIAVDAGASKDRFDVHMRSGFWNTTNAMCTPSTEVPGGCRFGGELMTDTAGRQMGDVTVGP